MTRKDISFEQGDLHMFKDMLTSREVSEHTILRMETLLTVGGDTGKISQEVSQYATLSLWRKRLTLMNNSETQKFMKSLPEFFELEIQNYIYAGAVQKATKARLINRSKLLEAIRIWKEAHKPHLYGA